MKETHTIIGLSRDPPSQRLIYPCPQIPNLSTQHLRGRLSIARLGGVLQQGGVSGRVSLEGVFQRPTGRGGSAPHQAADAVLG